uniref:C2H2-type domain-containing protein n=1 Tax=Globisporangium ultimum (strain ATCC 200006 / CBS 805.95 / DAOM BR144) TaxID=431595 RepID=K3X4K0_GLOUD
MGQDKGGNLGKAKRRRQPKKKVTGNDAQIQVRAPKSQTNALFTLATTSNPNPKHLGPFSDRQRILVVGDGDLSFSLSLAIFLGGRNLVATCYDSKREVKDKYTNAMLNADALESAGAQVHFDVDGTALENETWIHNADEKFHAIVFNFPHLGGATEEDVAKNQRLLRHFFYSTRPFLHLTRGQVLVALRNTLFYNRWKIQEQAQHSGFKMKKVEPFDGSIYSGYEPQRTHPASFRGEPPSTTGAHYYIFALDPTLQPDDPRMTDAQDDDAHSKAKPNTAQAAPKDAIKKVKQDKSEVAAASLECKVCATKFRDLKKYNAHINSAKHARKVKAQKKQRA